MVKPVDVNVKGKVIVPLPPLVEAMARKNLTFIEADYKKALYAVAFGQLMSDLNSGLKARQSSNGSWSIIDHSYYNKIVGYAELTSFETFRYVPCYSNVNFTLGDNSNWSRPFNFEVYAPVALKPFKSSKFINGVTSLAYIQPEVDSSVIDSDDDMLSDLDAKQRLSEIEMINRRTTNAFLRKFGVIVKNPDLQSNLDNSSSLISSFTK